MSAPPCLSRRRFLAAATPLVASSATLAQEAGSATVWVDAAGRATDAAHAALALLQSAPEDGLRAPEDETRALAHRARSAMTSEGAAAFAAGLDAALQRHLRALRHGQVDPARLGFRVRRSAATVPDTGQVAEAARSGRLAALAAAQRPVIGQYGRLREALAHYRTLAERPWPPLPPAPARLKPGQAWSEAPALRERLAALGDLPSESASSAAAVFDDALAAALARFQERHGLTPDGVPGPATWRALNVSPARRVRQLELALERLRWLPDLGGRRWIGINIPMYRLWAADLSGDQPLLTMPVVVGKALDTQTPVLQEDLRHLIFRPYWNVPRSIVRGEILPALNRRPDYLARHDMELVAGGGDDARAVVASPEHLAQLREGSLRLRQRPGPKNSLGLVKFVFPNAHDVYLHGTPAQSLFGRPRRDFSHGCVRLEDPVALATWVLREQPDWSRDRVEAAMTGGPLSRRVELRTPIPVLLFYLTALVGPGSEAVQFAEDVYGHDARLRRALAR